MCTVKGTVGSNPTLSAKLTKTIYNQYLFDLLYYYKFIKFIEFNKLKMKNFFLSYLPQYLEIFFLAIVNNFSRPKTIPANKLLNLIVISSGGVASTTLIKYLKLFKKVNNENDEDGYKHLGKFPFLKNSDTKILYIYGDYDKIYNSLKRRKFFKLQMAKLGCPLCLLFRGTLERFFFDRCITKQINNFKNKENVLILKFENIWKKKNEIKFFLGIDSDDFIKKFPLEKTN